jgi:hypothetical protein
MSALQKNAHWMGLFTLTLASLGGSYWLSTEITTLPDALRQLRPAPAKNKEAPLVDLSSLQRAAEFVSAPSLWNTDYASLLFVSEHYILEDGQPKRPKEGSIHAHSQTRQPIPNSWFIQNKLSLFSARVPLEDPDGDGFSNEEEWLAKTDPNDPASHPPLITKLYLTNLKTQNNRIRFLQYLGTPSKPETLRITVRPEDIPGAGQVELKIGAPIPNTQFKIKSFEYRRKKDPSGTFTTEASVVFIEHIPTTRVEVAELQQSANFTDQTAFFKLVFGSSEKEFSAKPGNKIALSEEETYDLVDASASSAKLRSAKGTEYEVKAGGSSSSTSLPPSNSTPSPASPSPKPLSTP